MRSNVETEPSISRIALPDSGTVETPARMRKFPGRKPPSPKKPEVFPERRLFGSPAPGSNSAIKLRCGRGLLRSVAAGYWKPVAVARNPTKKSAVGIRGALGKL